MLSGAHSARADGGGDDKPAPPRDPQKGDDLLAFQDVPLPLARPQVSYFLLAANLSVYAAGIAIALADSNEASNDFFLLLAKQNAEVANGEYWRLLTANFMHAGLLHLALNCLALFYIAPDAEAVFGGRRFLAIFLLTGLSGSVASYLLTDLVTVGASGALFGLLGALAAYFVRNPGLQRAQQQLFFILGVCALNLALGSDDGSMIDNTGHIAGFASGLWLGWWLSPRWKMSLETKQSTELTFAKNWMAKEAAAESASDEGPRMERWRGVDLDMDEIEGVPRERKPEPTAAESTAAAAAEAAPVEAAQNATIAALDALLPAPPPKPPRATPSQGNADATGSSEKREGATEATSTAEPPVEIKQVVVTDVLASKNATLRATILITFAAGLGILTWAGTVARLADSGLV